MKRRRKRKQLIIRKAVPGDAARILDLWKRLGEWLQAEGIDQWRPERLTLEEIRTFFDEGAEIYLAEMDGDLVGTYLIVWFDPSIWGEWDHAGAGYIHRLAVDRRYQGLGIGLRLLRDAEDRIRQNGKTTARLDCMADNERLNQYYRDSGYRFVGRKDHGHWSANLYEKELGEEQV